MAASVPAMALALWYAVTAYHFTAHPNGDFQVYRWAVHAWLGEGDLVHGWARLADGQLLPWVYPPFALLPLSPFALPPLSLGLRLMWAVNAAVIGMTSYLVVRHMWIALGRRGALAVAAATLPLVFALAL